MSVLGPFDTGKAFIGAVDGALDTALSDQGFLRLRKLAFVVPLNDEFDGWIGLNRNNKYARFGSIEVFANWGIHCHRIERFLSEGRRYRRGEFCTAPLSWSTEPTTRHFQFTATEDLVLKARGLALFYRNEAVPTMLEHASLVAIIPYLEDFAPRWGGRDQALLLAYQLAGQEEKSKAYLEERRKACANDAQYAAYFQPFLSRFLEHFGP